MTRSAFRRAGWSLLLLLSCNRDITQEPSVAPPAAADRTPPSPGSEPGDHAGRVCRVDADCEAGRFCELRVCVAGCSADEECPAGASCDAHGRCTPDMDEAPEPASGAPVLVERFTMLEFGEAAARTILRNDGAGVLKYRLDSANPALDLDPTLAELAPGAEVELRADVHVEALAATDRLLPVQIVTSGGTLSWSIEIEAAPESGQFRGAVAFEVGGAGLGGSDLVLDLDFRDDGTIAGRVDTDASLLWPQPLALTGTWAPSGNVTIELRDRLPADGWRYSPLARELGRTFIFTGTRSAAGLEGTLVESITGLRETPVQVEGTFVLRHYGPLTGLVHAAEDPPGPAVAPAWLAPPSLDADACEGLGIA